MPPDGSTRSTGGGPDRHTRCPAADTTRPGHAALSADRRPYARTRSAPRSDGRGREAPSRPGAARSVTPRGRHPQRRAPRRAVPCRAGRAVPLRPNGGGREPRGSRRGGRTAGRAAGPGGRKAKGGLGRAAAAGGGPGAAEGFAEGFSALLPSRGPVPPSPPGPAPLTLPRRCGCPR